MRRRLSFSRPPHGSSPEPTSSLPRRDRQVCFSPFERKKVVLGFGAVRDVNYKTKGTGGASEVPEEKARATDGIVPLQSGTNKLASQAGMTGMGMPRIVDGLLLSLTTLSCYFSPQDHRPGP